MAREWVKTYAESSQGDVIQDYTVADGTGIEKGTLLKLTDPRTAIATTTVTDGEACAGVCAREKIGNDGRTSISVYKKGIFQASASGAITVGQPIMSAGDNNVSLALSSSSGAALIGYAEETAADAEVIRVRLDL
tara:strand:- start:4250 stop:4654 length:405 start_codon:yes stop_codon:yes gene_type:complete